MRQIRPHFFARCLGGWFFLLFLLAGMQAWAATPMVSAGDSRSCALLSSGDVQCWGRSWFNGNVIISTSPVSVSGISNATSVSSGHASCAALSSGAVQCWDGGGTFGGLNFCTVASTDSVWCWYYSTGAVNSNAISVSEKYGSYCAVLSSGVVQCWGDNFWGQRGNVKSSNDSSVSVIGISNATSVSAGGSYSCAVLSGGAVQCWGLNSSGQLGNGSQTINPSPASVTGISSPVSVIGISNATSVSAGAKHACALLANGSVQCWGDNSNGGQLGNGSSIYESLIPVSVIGINNAISVSVGGSHSCALLSSGSVQCWGHNHDGELGNGSTADSSIPVSVSGISNATSVAAGSTHSCAVLTSGSVVCWGSNKKGQLGNGNTADSLTPVEVTGLNLGVVGLPPKIKLATADSTGVRATIVPFSSEMGQPFSVYAGAVLGSSLYLRGNAFTEWTLYEGGTVPVAQQVPSMPASLPVDVVRGDISRFTGMDIYAAYGDLSAPGHAAKLLTIQKRTTVHFPNAASPISMASLSPFGSVIATRRNVAGSQNVLDIIEPDGTYYQLSTGVNGLPQVVLDGFTISVLATDAMGLVSQVGVKEPNGTFTAIDKPVTVAARSIALRSAPRSASSVTDCSNLTDAERELVCRIVLQHGHPTFELIRGAYEILRAYYARRGEPVVAAVVQGWNWANRLLGLTATSSSTEVEVADTGAELVSQGTQPGGRTAYTYPDVPNVSGSNEVVTRQIAADTKKLANNQRDLITVDALRVGVVNGASVTPAYCASIGPINGVCIPAITRFDPSITVAGQDTSLHAMGTDLTNDMVVQTSIQCNQPVLKSTGSSIEQSVLCTPSRAGTMTVQWYMAGTGRLIATTNVTVCEATQTIVNDACVTLDPVCTLPKILVNHVCETPVPNSCTYPKEIFRGTCFDPATMACPTPSTVCTNFYNVQTGQTTQTCTTTAVPSSCKGGGTSTGTGTCATGNDPALIGTWSGTSGNNLQLSFDRCHEHVWQLGYPCSFIYSYTANGGSIQGTLTTTTGPSQCYAYPSSTGQYSISGSTLTISSSSGTGVYTKTSSAYKP